MLIQKYNYKTISRDTIEGKRHYCLPDGSKVPSVTTILDRTKPQADKDALDNWRKAVGDAKATAIVTEAANRGTRMHKWLEDYVRNNRVLGTPGSNPFSKQSHKMAQEIIDKGLVNVQEMWGIEVPLYFSGLYAGTTDACGIYSNAESIIDYKQTNKPKTDERVRDYFIQLCAYGLAHNETHGTNIKQGVILMCSAEYQFQTWTVSGKDWDYWTDEWLKRVELYYLMS